jgi:hypothetical protein
LLLVGKKNKKNKRVMEGLLPFLYRAIVLHFADGGGRSSTGGSSFIRGDSPSASRYYVPLADDSGGLAGSGSSPPRCRC